MKVLLLGSSQSLLSAIDIRVNVTFRQFLGGPTYLFQRVFLFKTGIMSQYIY